MLQANLLYINQAVSNFYGTEFVIWAGFGPVGSIEKKIGLQSMLFLRAVFSCFHRQFFFLNIVLTVRTEKLHYISLIIFFFFFKLGGQSRL